MAASLTVSGNSVSLPQLADFLQAQEFIYSDELLTAIGGASSGSPTALYTGRGRNQTGKGSTGWRHGFNGQGRNRGNRGGQGRGGLSVRGGGQPRCQTCRSHGHSAIYYFKRYTTQPPAQANLAVPGDDAALTVAGSWFPDTGASAHATPDASMMSQSEKYNDEDVLRVGNGTCLVISRVGSASIPSVSKPLKLSNVLHVPNLSVPLLSVQRFTNENNVFFEFHRNYFVVKDSITRAILLKGSGPLQVDYTDFRSLSRILHLLVPVSLP
ncbi:PREDICTED: uncharacterized protein LOC109175376 [Ipomoea nil]|uniref:uncharacterized protein LOC109175376 n=1 Tax=Ipomoea nil TaxID=35883 RepID=UPI000900934B|nr:PREDICTED: uncharacterized protein LOC109175376 [Ipomoea nil]